MQPRPRAETLNRPNVRACIANLLISPGAAEPWSKPPRKMTDRPIRRKFHCVYSCFNTTLRIYPIARENLYDAHTKTLARYRIGMAARRMHRAIALAAHDAVELRLSQ